MPSSVWTRRPWGQASRQCWSHVTIAVLAPSAVQFERHAVWLPPVHAGTVGGGSGGGAGGSAAAVLIDTVAVVGPVPTAFVAFTWILKLWPGPNGESDPGMVSVIIVHRAVGCDGLRTHVEDIGGAVDQHGVRGDVGACGAEADGQWYKDQSPFF